MVAVMAFEMAGYDRGWVATAGYSQTVAVTAQSLALGMGHWTVHRVVAASSSLPAQTRVRMHTWTPGRSEACLAFWA